MQGGAAVAAQGFHAQVHAQVQCCLPVNKERSCLTAIPFSGLPRFPSCARPPQRAGVPGAPPDSAGADEEGNPFDVIS